MAYTHDITGMNAAQGAHLSAEKNAELLKRIQDLKRQNTVLHQGSVPNTKSGDEIYQEILDSCNKFVSTPTDDTENKLAKVLEENNLVLHSYVYDKTSQDKRDVARMAFNGYVDRPPEFKLSPIMREMKNYPQKRSQTKPEDYDLSASSVWNVFKQVPEFAATEEKLKKGLAIYGIPPEKLPELQCKDFCFILNDQYRTSGKDSAKVFQEGYKARFTKQFIAEYENEFRQGLMSMKGIRKDYVESLISSMKRGITDMSKSPYWKPEWSNQPVVDVHHILNIKDASVREAEGNSFASINSYENMCFIVRHPQHNAMHALEQDLNNNYHEDIFYNREIDKKYIYRIQPPEGVKCMLGFNTFIYDRQKLGVEKSMHQQQKREKPLSEWRNRRAEGPKHFRGNQVFSRNGYDRNAF